MSAAPIGFFAQLLNSNEQFLIPLPKRLNGAHVDRKNEWTFSREVLRRAFENAGVKFDLSLFDTENKQKLEGLDEWSFSVSHTDGISVAWVAKSSDVLGLGVDVELSGRTLSRAASERLVNSSDTIAPGIELWSVKEAAYKAFYLTGLQEKLSIKDIVINQGTFSALGVSGFWQQSYKDRYLISFAWISRAT